MTSSKLAARVIGIDVAKDKIDVSVASLEPLFPQLEILGLLGHGGMGAVYKARQKKLDRLVALKIIRPEAATDPAFAERFNREARTLARLSHPTAMPARSG